MAKKQTLSFLTGQVWYPEDATRPGRRVAFTSADIPGPWMRGLIDDFQQVAYLEIDRNGNALPIHNHSENGVSWHSRVMVESFRAWVRKTKATLKAEPEASPPKDLSISIVCNDGNANDPGVHKLWFDCCVERGDTSLVSDIEAPPGFLSKSQADILDALKAADDDAVDLIRDQHVIGGRVVLLGEVVCPEVLRDFLAA